MWLSSTHSCKFVSLCLSVASGPCPLSNPVPTILFGLDTDYTSWAPLSPKGVPLSILESRSSNDDFVIRSSMLRFTRPRFRESHQGWLATIRDFVLRFDALSINVTGKLPVDNV